MNLIQTLEREQMEAARGGRKLPDFRPGDTLKVNVKVVDVSYDEKSKQQKTRERLQAFEGVCIARSGAGLNESFTVRKISYGEGVEIPSVLLSGNHAEIARWRRAEAEKLTKQRRPDLWSLYEKASRSARRPASSDLGSAKTRRKDVKNEPDPNA